jgi:hypothetical protein
MTHLCNMDTPERVESMEGYARGSWLVARGSWLVARGSWLVARGSWLVARGSWLVGKTKPPGLIVLAACDFIISSFHRFSLFNTAVISSATV